MKEVSFWDNISDNYDKELIKHKEAYERMLNNTKKHLTLQDNVLDYACGTGKITLELASNVKNILGVDFSSKMVKIAKRKIEENKCNNMKAVQATLFDESLKKESFDVILGFNILHLLKNQHEIMLRIHELLKPNGKFISATPCLREKTSFMRFFLPIFSKIGLAPYVKSLKYNDVKTVISQNKFNILESECDDKHDARIFIVAKKV